MKQMSVTPAPANAATAQSSKRRPFTSAKHLGVSAVVGINRRPRPAPMMMALIIESAPSENLLAAFAKRFRSR
jgi:hypothetical protein